MVGVVSGQPITVFRQLSLSADGNLLAFVSNAPLQPDHDTDSTDDVYRYRLADESLRLESVGGDSAPGSGARLSPRLSVDDTTPTFQAIGSG